MITSKELAELCGVSRGTVDRVMNNRPGVNPKKRELILNTAKQLGYKPNYIASCLSRQRTNTVGIMVFDLNNRFFSQIVDAAETRLRELGYFAYISLTRKDPQTEADCIEKLITRNTDGIIIIPCGKESTAAALGKTPTVCFGNQLNDLSYVGVDEYAAGEAAARHILSKGYQRVIYAAPALAFGNESNIWAQQRRYEGFLSVTNAKLVTRLDFPSLIHQKEKTAIFFPTDINALKALSYCKENGIIPGCDIGLMGFDCIDTLSYITPKLDTVSFPVHEIGRELANAVVSFIEGIEYTPPALNVHVVNGETL